MSQEANQDEIGYNEAMARLREIVDKLQSEAGEPDIDGLVQSVEDGLKMGNICRQRLDKVSALLNEAFRSSGARSTDDPT